jgi:transketolase
VTSGILDVGLESVFHSFGWHTQACDGHSMADLSATFAALDTGSPNVILAKTVKGKGVSFMENNNTWHHNRLNGEQYQNALREVEDLGL